MLGNGFDLAHGLKTGYKDFLREYVRGASFVGIKVDDDDFLKKILENQSLRGWVDIEQEYYDELKKIVSSPSNSEQRIKRLHKSFGQMQETLEAYLNGIQSGIGNREKVFENFLMKP